VKEIWMKTMVSILGTALLVTAVAFAQTAASSSSTSSKKSATTTSSPYSTSKGDSSTSTVKAGNSGFDAGLPQSDSSAASTSAQPGSPAYGASGQAGSATQTTSGASYTTQSGSSDEITNGPVAETVSDSSATIGWSTRNSASGTAVKYGSSRANLSETAQATDGSDGKNHHAKLQGLSANTRYYFQVVANGQPVGGIGTFKTTAPGETPVQSKAVIPQK
jgi:hypothetical protein